MLLYFKRLIEITLCVSFSQQLPNQTNKIVLQDLLLEAVGRVHVKELAQHGVLGRHSCRVAAAQGKERLHVARGRQDPVHAAKVNFVVGRLSVESGRLRALDSDPINPIVFVYLKKAKIIYINVEKNILE